MLLTVWLSEASRGLWVERCVGPEHLAAGRDGIVMRVRQINSLCQRPVGMSDGED